MKQGWVYIMTNKHNTTLYVGVTSNLYNRVQQHQHKHYPDSFSAKYNTDRLVYYEMLYSITSAISREKEIKKWRREKKDALIDSLNPKREDLWEKEVRHW
jgi:putative endonuclease